MSPVLIGSLKHRPWTGWLALLVVAGISLWLILRGSLDFDHFLWFVPLENGRREAIDHAGSRHRHDRRAAGHYASMGRPAGWQIGQKLVVTLRDPPHLHVVARAVLPVAAAGGRRIRTTGDRVRCNGARAGLGRGLACGHARPGLGRRLGGSSECRPPARLPDWCRGHRRLSRGCGALAGNAAATERFFCSVRRPYAKRQERSRSDLPRDVCAAVSHGEERGLDILRRRSDPAAGPGVPCVGRKGGPVHVRLHVPVHQEVLDAGRSRYRRPGGAAGRRPGPGPRPAATTTASRYT